MRNGQMPKPLSAWPAISDMETCTKAFRRKIIQSIRVQWQHFGFEPEITAKVDRSAAPLLDAYRRPRSLWRPLPGAAVFFACS